MHHRFDSRLVVTLASIVAFAAIACSAAPVPQSEQDPQLKTKPPAKSNDPATDTDPATPTPTTPTPPAAAECSKKADGNACFECCYQKSPAEADKADEVFFSCVCDAPGACKADCADSVCGTDATKQPSAACTTCMQTNGAACETKAEEACKASAGCTQVQQCADTECAAFPETP